MNLPMNWLPVTPLLWIGFCLFLGCFGCCVWFVVEDNGFLDYVQVLHQFSFVTLNQQTALRVNLEINAFTMP